MTQLYFSGKITNEISKEQDLKSTSVYTWMKQLNRTKLFEAKDNMTHKLKE